MKKNLLLVTASLLALGMAAPAMAADLAARPYTKAPAPVVSPMYDWSGFYIGINGGGGSSRWGADDGHISASGGTFGGQIGYRWQAANWVFGIEGQGNWADFKHSESYDFFFNTLHHQAELKTDAFGLLTGQVGYAWNNVLLYVKGGAAVVSTKFNHTDTVIATGALDFAESASETRWGGTVGAGLEVGFAPNWTVGVEYNHIFLSHNNDANTFLSGVDQDIDIGLVRLNYKFGPGIARF